MILKDVAKSQGVPYLSPLGSGGLVASLSAKRRGGLCKIERTHSLRNGKWENRLFVVTYGFDGVYFTRFTARSLGIWLSGQVAVG